MPIDASIPFRALGQQFDPLQAASQMQQLKAGQMQLDQQARQAKQQQQQEQDDRTLQIALAQTQGDMGKAIALTAGKVSPQRTLALQKFDAEHRKSLLDNTKTQNELEADTNSKLAALVEQAKTLPPDQYAQQYPQIAAAAISIQPKLQTHIDPNTPIPQDQLSGLQIGFLTQAQYHAQTVAQQSAAEEARKAAIAPSQLAASQADAQLKQANAAAGGSPEQLNARDELRYRQLAAKQAGGMQLSSSDSAFMKGYEKAKTIGPRTTFALQQGGGAPPKPDLPADMPLADKYKTFGAQGNMIRGIVEGRQKPPSGFAMKSPYWQNVMNGVYQIDPEWSEQRAQLRTGMTTGSQSKEIGSINVALGHMGVLNDAIDALKNGNIKVLNSIANRIGAETGNDATTIFNTIVHRVGPEIAKAYIGAGGSAGERGSDEKDFDASLGDKQLKSNVAVSAKLLRSKIGYYENLWDKNRAPGMKSFDEQFMTPEAKQSLQKLNPQTSSEGGISVSAPDGKTYTFKDQASAAAFKQKAGIQ